MDEATKTPRALKSIFDALGHDLSAGLLASVGIASCRGTRRAAGSLTAIAARADDAIAGSFGEERFVTALLCDLDLATGLFTWIPCGHPPPLLIRGRTVKELARTARPPLGLGDVYACRGKRPHDDAVSVPLCAERLEPRDRVLLYTDGVTEGRAADGFSACSAWLTSSSGTTARSCLHPRRCAGSTARSSSTSRASCATTQPPS